MSERASLVPLPGSTRAGPVHQETGACDPEASATITIYVRGSGGNPVPGRLTREAYAEAHGAAKRDIDVVREFAARRGLSVGQVDGGRRSIELAGKLDALAAAFGTTLSIFRDGTGLEYRARKGQLFVPAELDGVVTGVFGLDERPQARPQFRPRANATSQYTQPQVATAYAFPAGLTGKGECIALIELGGGFRSADISAYFSMLRIAPPAVVAVPVGGGRNDPGTADGPDGEVMLDIEVAGSVASEATIAVYFAPNTDRGFIDAVTTAVHDADHRPSIVSISWGSAEDTWTAQAMTQMEQAFVAAAAMGVSVTVAAGDNGSSDGASDGLQHADFPASAPHALGCGGTRLTIVDAAIAAETVWNDGPGQGAGGGGISDVFPVPDYQRHASIPPSANPGAHVGRGVPDVCGDADPDTGYTVRVDGQTIPIGGTSAVAPLWAGLIALLNQGLGKPVGFLHPHLYAAAGNELHDIVSGSNGLYSAGLGWDACTGLGSPDGTELLKALSGR
ncbi:MAG TPA: S53 family peptidase [Candidatus Saccharimonadales bacterium]|nr:S53 family peptidase [Candidatus Saccharimonadales bacterium]